MAIELLMYCVVVSHYSPDFSFSSSHIPYFALWKGLACETTQILSEVKGLAK